MPKWWHSVELAHESVLERAYVQEVIPKSPWVFGILCAVIVGAGVTYGLFVEPTQAPATPNRAQSSRVDSSNPNRLAAQPTYIAVGARHAARPDESKDLTLDVLQQKLEPLALHGDLKAASELSRSALRCYTAVSDIAMLQAHLPRSLDSDQDEPTLSQTDLDTIATIERIEELKRNSCDLLSRETIASLARSATKNAARLGDFDAQLCVIEQGFLLPRARDLTPDEQANGEIYHADYQEQALDRGDWRVVYLMLARTLSIGRGPIHARIGVSPIDPVTYLRSLRLLRLGAIGDYATTLDHDIEIFLAKTNPEMIDEDRGLSDRDIADAAAWAEAEYRSHFSQSPPLTEQPVPCGDY